MSERPPPAARVVIPAHDAEAFLAETLDSLVGQVDAPPFEVVVVVSASTDRTADVAAAYGSSLDLRVVHEARRGGNVARNRGAALEGRPDVLLFLDHDDVAEPGWVRAMVERLDEADVALGTYAVDRLNTERTRALRGEVSFTDPPDEYDPGSLTGQGGNCGFRTSAWRLLGGLDESQHYVDDVEILWRAHDAGLSIRYAGSAVVQYRLREGGLAYFRQYVHRHQGWAALHARHPERVRRRSGPDAIRQWAWLVRHLPDSWSGDLRRRGQWIRAAARAVGSLTGSAKARTFYP